MSDKRSRNFGGVLYPDAENYNFSDILREGQNYFQEFAFILHDKDLDENGNLKKPHFHWLGRRKNGVHLSTVAKVMGIDEHHIEMIRNWQGSVRYLTHVDYPDKFQYSIENIEGSMKDLYSYFEIISEGEAVINIIKQRDEGKSYRQILFDSVEKGYYSHFRRNLGIVQMIEEDDRKFKEKKLLTNSDN